MCMGTITAKQRAAITHKLATIDLTTGEASINDDHACTISAINIALGHGVTARLDRSMSEVVHYWVNAVQDTMPDEMRAVGDEHGDRWRKTAPLIAGSAHAGPSETERVQILLEWMWECLARDWKTCVPFAMQDVWANMLASHTRTPPDASDAVAVAEWHTAEHAYWAAADAGRIGHRIPDAIDADRADKADIAAHLNAAVIHAGEAIWFADPAAHFVDPRDVPSDLEPYLDEAAGHAASAVAHKVSGASFAGADAATLWRQADPASVLARMVGAVA